MWLTKTIYYQSGHQCLSLPYMRAVSLFPKLVQWSHVAIHQCCTWFPPISSVLCSPSSWCCIVASWSPCIEWTWMAGGWSRSATRRCPLAVRVMAWDTAGWYDSSMCLICCPVNKCQSVKWLKYQVVNTSSFKGVEMVHESAIRKWPLTITVKVLVMCIEKLTMQFD